MSNSEPIMTSSAVHLENKNKQPNVTVSEVVPSVNEAQGPAASKKKRKKTAAQKAATTATGVTVRTPTQHDTESEPVAEFLSPGPSRKHTATIHHHHPVAQAAVVAHVNDEGDNNDNEADTEADHANAHGHAPEVEDSSTPHECQCTCAPLIPCTVASPSKPYSAAYFEQWKALYPGARKSMPTILKAANLKLHADHAHNTWYHLIIAVRACKCPSCSDVTFNPETNTLGNSAHNWESYGKVKSARVEYKKLEEEFDRLLEQKRTVIFKEWLTTEDAKGWPKKEVLSTAQIKGMLPNGRDKRLDVGANPGVDFEDVIARLKLCDKHREAMKVQLGLGG